MKPLSFILLLVAVIATACPYFDDYKFDEGTFPAAPVNLEDGNSIYDDYNSAFPSSFGGSSELWFSTNRRSGGNNYDIINTSLDISFKRTTGILTVRAGAISTEVLSLINTPYDEMGPYLLTKDVYESWGGTGLHVFIRNYLFYATSESGNLNIMLTQNVFNEEYSTPEEVFFLNSDKDDAYPTMSSDDSTIYFCSDRDEGFDIYKAKAGKNFRLDLMNILHDSIITNINKDTILSSDYDDKCPFIEGKLMIFTSNRPKGFGGYDLYYSTFENNRWTIPVNFGDMINTEYDEFRPIIKTYMHDFTNDLMVFSSNRPGGKGGFDLYYVGIEKMTD